MGIVGIARELAGRAHAGQTRPNAARSPMSEHYEEVAALTASFGGTEAEIAAALLHDTVEDTGLTLGDIERAVGGEVARIVDGLTDPPHFEPLPLWLRKRLQADRLRTEGREVKRPKIADQTSNVRTLVADPPVGWDARRCMEYADGALMIVDACRADWPDAAEVFDDAYRRCAAVHRDAALGAPARRRLPRIRIAGAAAAAGWQCDAPHVVVSISTPGNQGAEWPASPARLGTLRLAFDDLDDAGMVFTDGGWRTIDEVGRERFLLFGEAQAALVVEFLARHLGAAEVVLVQCEAGRSRSAGLAAALLRWLHGDADAVFRDASFAPNLRVYREMLAHLDRRGLLRSAG